MRAIVVVGVMVTAGCVNAQQPSLSATIDPLTAAYIGGAICGYDVDAEKFARALAQKGLDASGEAGRRELAESLGRSSALWISAKAAASVSKVDKLLFEQNCDGVLAAVGPGGSVSPGIVSRKK